MKKMIAGCLLLSAMVAYGNCPDLTGTFYCKSQFAGSTDRLETISMFNNNDNVVVYKRISQKLPNGKETTVELITDGIERKLNDPDKRDAKYLSECDGDILRVNIKGIDPKIGYVRGKTKYELNADGNLIATISAETDLFGTINYTEACTPY